MRRTVTLLAALCPMVTGCALLGGDRGCGLHVEILLPPVVKTQTPVLIQNTGQSLTAHPMGTLAGPVTSGQSIHGPSAPLQIAPAPMPVGPRTGAWMDCGPVMPQAGWMRVEDVMKLQQSMQPSGTRTANGQEE